GLRPSTSTFQWPLSCNSISHIAKGVPVIYRAGIAAFIARRIISLVKFVSVIGRMNGRYGVES
ncbi:hypothetical protein QUC29_15405, partial [Klebsiella oxytoca]|nr:hypothetical protein [Klebsiella oxytoca]